LLSGHRVQGESRSHLGNPDSAVIDNNVLDGDQDKEHDGPDNVVSTNHEIAKRFYDSRSWKHSSFGLYPRKRWIEINEEGDSPLALIVGNEVSEGDGFFAVSEDSSPVLVIGYDKAANLSAKSDTFKKRTFLDLGKFSALEIVIGKQRCLANVTDGKWEKIVKDEAKTSADIDKLGAKLVSVLEDLSYGESISKDVFGQVPFGKEVVLIIRCFSGGGGKVKIVEFVQSDKSGFVTVNDSDVVYKITLATLAKAFNASNEFLEAE